MDLELPTYNLERGRLLETDIRVGGVIEGVETVSEVLGSTDNSDKDGRVPWQGDIYVKQGSHTGVTSVAQHFPYIGGYIIKVLYVASK